MSNKNEEAVKNMLKKGKAHVGDHGGFVWKFSGMRNHWCAMFVCWCAHAGFGDKWRKYVAKTWIATIPRDTVQKCGGKWVKPPGGKMKTTPQPGDIWATNGYTHAGLVYSVNKKNKTIRTLEGNTNSYNYNKSVVAQHTYPYSHFGCIARPKWGAVGNLSGDEEDSGGPGVDLKETIKELYSSDNYDYLKNTEEEDTAEDSRVVQSRENFRSALTKLNDDMIDSGGKSSGALSESDSKVIATGGSGVFSSSKKYRSKRIVSQNLTSYPSLIEAPLIEVSLNGVVIGGYGNSGDKFPNYFQNMTIDKINGRINQYTINLSYQIRDGEDPNFIDKLLSKTGYTNIVKIKYGDSYYPSLFFNEVQAVITDATQSEDVANHTINYTLTAMSSVLEQAGQYLTFPAITAKPSTVIRKLIYEDNKTSKEILEAFPGMKNRTLVESSGLIPTDDDVVNISGMRNVKVTEYLAQLVGSMNNSSQTSTYYLNYLEDTDNKFGGAYISVNEITSYDNISYSALSKGLYQVDVGYPGDNFVTSFQLDNNVYWPLVYEYNSSIPVYDYDIDNYGNISKTRSNSLYMNNDYNSSSAISENWWKDVTEFPITASLTLKGLVRPMILTSYIYVNAVFYGVKDIATGMYVVTAQQDNLSSSGYTTTLTLLRVSS